MSLARLPVTLRASPRAPAAFGEIFGRAAGPALAAALPPDEDGWRVVTLSFEHERAAAHRLAGFGGPGGGRGPALGPGRAGGHGPAAPAALPCRRRLIVIGEGMAGEPVTVGDGSGHSEVIELSSVPGFVVFDLPGVPESAGGTRLTPDVSIAEVMLLARAMTYKYAALGAQMGGAKAGVRGDPADRAGKAALMARFCAEIAPLTDTGPLLTGPDMGTAEAISRRCASAGPRRAVIRAVVDGVPFEDLLTGFGVAVAAEAALGERWGGGWNGRSVAIEGFGKVGGGVAREVTRRGGRVTAVSTMAGCVMDPAGLDTERLLALRRTHGDACVLHYGLAGPPGELFTAADAEVVVPGTRPGVISGRVAGVAASVRPGRRARGERALHQTGSRRAAPARHRRAARLRVQRGRGHRLPVGCRRDPGRGPGRGRSHGRRPDPRRAASPVRPAGPRRERARQFLRLPRVLPGLPYAPRAE